MKSTLLAEGKLNVTVSSENSTINSGTYVVVIEVVDNFKNIFILVKSIYAEVKLNYFDTDVNFLLGVK